MKKILISFILFLVLLSFFVNAQVATIPNSGSYPEYGDDFLYLAKGGYATLNDADVDDIDYANEDFSMEALIDVRSNQPMGDSYSGIITKNDVLGNDAGWGLGMSNSDWYSWIYQVRFRISDGTNHLYLYSSKNGLIHVVVTWDRISRNATMYFNGVQVHSNSNTNIIPSNIKSSKPLQIGIANSQEEINRNILMVRWWKEKLSAQTIQALYNNWKNKGDDRIPAGISTSNLLSEWLMNEEVDASGATGTGYIKDNAGNNHLQLAGNAVLRISKGESLALVYPADGATGLNKSVALKARGGDASIGGQVVHPFFYFFQVDTSPTFDSPNLKESGWIPHYADYIPLLNPSTRYYWRVKVKDMSGSESSYTSAWSFTTEPSISWYVRPEGGSYGTEDGTSYNNAWNGLQNVIWGSDGVEAGDTLYICGLHLRTRTGGSAWETIFPMANGGSEDSRIIIRGDCPGNQGINQGIIWGAGIMAHEPWVNEGGGVYSITAVGTPSRDWYFEDITKDSWIVYDRANSLEECRATPGSFYSPDYAAGSKLYIHTSDGNDPTNRITANRLGYNLYVNDNHYITWANLKFYGIHRWIDYGGNPPFGFVTHMTWENCTIWYGEFIHFLFRNNNAYGKFINCDVAWAKNGIGFAESPIGSGSTGDGSEPHDWVIRGCKIHHIGFKYGDSDAHAIAGQGSRNIIMEYNELYNTGTGITFYCYNENQAIKNITVRYNWVHDTHSNGGANDNGITINTGPAQALGTSADVYGNIVGPNITNVCYRYFWEELGEFYNNVAYECGTSFYFHHHLFPVHVKMRNTISINPRAYHIRFSSNSNRSGEYMLDSDYNLFYPIEGEKFFFWDRGCGDHTRPNEFCTGMNYTQWQSIPSPGSTFDPHSIVADPLFVDPANIDFHLLAGSPAIDMGVDVGLANDRIGTPIPQGTRPDIGAFEYIFGTGCGPADLNCDGSIDIFDLIMVASDFGLTSGFDAKADTDNSGDIDILDLVYVATRFT